MFTWISGMPIRKPSIYGRPRFAYLLAHCLRALPASLSANARLTRVPEATSLKRPKDAGSRPTSHCAPLRPDSPTNPVNRASPPEHADQAAQQHRRRTSSVSYRSSSLPPRTSAQQRGREKKQRQSSRELKNKPCFATGVALPQPAARASPARPRS